MKVEILGGCRVCHVVTNEAMYHCGFWHWCMKGRTALPLSFLNWKCKVPLVKACHNELGDFSPPALGFSTLSSQCGISPWCSSLSRRPVQAMASITLATQLWKAVKEEICGFGPSAESLWQIPHLRSVPCATTVSVDRNKSEKSLSNAVTEVQYSK